MPAQAFDLASLMGEAVTQANASQTAGNAAQAGYNEIGDILNKKADDAKATKQAAEQIETIKLQEQARRNASISRLQMQLGMDPTASGELITQFGNRAIEADKQIQEASATLAKIDSMSFLENPIGFLVAHMDRNKYVSQYYAAEQDRDSARTTAADLQKLSTDGTQNIIAQGSTISEAYIQASRVVAGHQFAVEATDAAVQAKRYNIEGIQAAANGGKDRIQLLFSANAAQMQEKQYQNSLEHTRIARAQFDLAKTAHDLKMHEDDLAASLIKQGYLNLNGKPLPDAQAKEYAKLVKVSPDIAAMFASGLDYIHAGGHQMISSSPFDASGLVMNRKVHNLPPAQQQVAEQLATWRTAWEKTADGGAAMASKDKNTAERSFNTWVQAQSMASINLPTAIQTTTTNNKSAAALPVYQNILGPASKAGVDVNDPNTAFGLILNAMRNGKLSYLDAADYSNLIGHGLDINNQTRNFAAFGLHPPRKYEVEINIPGSIGKTKVNLVDQNSFMTALNKAAAATAMNGVNAGPMSGLTVGVEFANAFATVGKNGQ